MQSHQSNSLWLQTLPFILVLSKTLIFIFMSKLQFSHLFISQKRAQNIEKGSTLKVEIAKKILITIKYQKLFSAIKRITQD